MKSDPPEDHAPETDACPRVRLAQGGLASVDACQCGMLQLHLGALTVRMTPSALAELESTLRTALSEHQKRFGEPEDQFDELMMGGRTARGAA
jgi:hypothetical protein